MKFIKLTIIALVGLLVTTTSCEKEEPKPVPPTHLGLWELQSIRTIEYFDSKIVDEKTEYLNSSEDEIERLEFIDGSNGFYYYIYPNNAFPQEIDTFTYRIEGANLIMTDWSEDAHILYNFNVQAQKLTFSVYHNDEPTDPDRTETYLEFKKM